MRAVRRNLQIIILTTKLGGSAKAPFSNSINEFGIKKAIIPAAYLGQRFDISTTGTLSLRTPQIVFLKSPIPQKSEYWSGDGIYRLNSINHIFPETISKKEKIGDEDFRKGWSAKGINYRDEKASLIAWLEDEEYLNVKFRLNKNEFSQAFAINFPCGFRHAISFLLGIEAKRLFSEVICRSSNLSVVKKITEVQIMRVYNGLNTFQFFSSELVWKLSKFFTLGYLNEDRYKESFVARRILYQLIEAEQQKTFAAQELLTATILEAALRTLFDIPYVKNSKSNFQVENYLKNNFIREYTDGKKWREVRIQVAESFKNIRHRNAHPDWLIGEQDVYNDKNISDTFYDLRIMIKFYQQMILLMAGIKNVEPKLPEKI